jgi:prolyl oligopeptidase
MKTMLRSPVAYPDTVECDQFDVYHGVRVTDPYRWLEDSESPGVSAWIEAQRAITENYLSQLPDRQALLRRFDDLLDYPRRYHLARVGTLLLYMKNSGRQKQLVLCVQDGWQGKEQILFDPAEMEIGGPRRLATFAASRDGRYVAYSVSQPGSEEFEIRVLELGSRSELGNRVSRVEPVIAWSGLGFYYTRFPNEDGDNRGNVTPFLNHQVWYHRVGAQECDDELVYSDSNNPHRLYGVTATESDSLTIMTTVDPASGHAGTAIHALIRAGCSHSVRTIVSSFDAQLRFVGLAKDGALLFLTNLHAPNWRLIRINPGSGDAMQWDEVIPERQWPLEQVKRVGLRYITVYRRDGTHQLGELDETGIIGGEIHLPELGTIYLAQGEESEDMLLLTHTAFTKPPTVYTYDLHRQRLEQLWPSSLPFKPEDFTTTRVTYFSSDGTPIPMFLVHHTSIAPGVERPVLVYGYGGNGISAGPAFDPLLLALLERGVTLAVPCLRGGGEFGDAWHKAGVRERKQTVFDDCIAAVEWLHAHNYSRPEGTALFGDSNGGLLAGALLTQRPDLFAAVVAAYGVLDMLRYQHFTIGRAWIAEYGASDDPEMFPYLLAYSPLHRIRAGVHYPPTLALTSEQDERVVPAHSYKLIATLQAKGVGTGPYLIRIDADTGHAPHSLPKELAERADVYAFLLTHIAAARPNDG